MTSAVESVGALLTNLSASLVDPRVWQSVLVAIVAGAVILAIGAWCARRVGLLDAGSSDARVLGVGLATGLLIVTATGAAVISAGRSVFTPVAVGLLVGVAIGGSRPASEDVPRVRRWFPIGARAAVGATLFVVGFGLLYAATMAPSARDGVQPVAFMDEAFYSILGRDLVATGTETWTSPSGFAALPGMPAQMWYHWGELWLAGILGTATGINPMFARHLVALPLLLLAATVLTGLFVNACLRSRSRLRWPFVLGAVSCVVLAPIPVPFTYFSSWATGLLFGITVYGLAAVIVVSALYFAITRPIRRPTGAQTLFLASWAVSLLPAHVLLAGLAVIGVATAVGVRALVAFTRDRTMPVIPRDPRALPFAVLAIGVVTVAWGFATGHGLPTSGTSPQVQPFNASWLVSVVAVVLLAGAFLCIPFAWLAVRRRDPTLSSIFIGTAAIVASGAIAWGARLGDFNTFHLLFGAIAVFATPVAAGAVAIVWARSRDGYGRAVLLGIVATQIGIGVFAGVARLQAFGPHDYQPIPVAILDSIAGLEPGAKLAYECQPLEEIAIWDPRLASIDASTGRRVVPLCFQADYFSSLTGARIDPSVVSPLFTRAPQLGLYPTSSARPADQDVLEFMRRNRIDYILVDPDHPNGLIVGATPVATSGAFQILRIPAP